MLIAGCGIDSLEPAPPEPPPPPPLEFVGGEAGITRTTDSAGNVRYLGELENTRDEVACNIGVTVNSYDAFDNLLSNPGNQQSGFANLLGESFRFSAFTPDGFDNCLSPGKRASFDIRNDFPPSRVARIELETSCDEPLFDGCLSQGQPFAPPTATLAVFGQITEEVTTGGRVMYRGVIRNQSPAGFATTYHIKIVFTVRNAAGLVVDVACATIDGPDCPLPPNSTPSNSGLGPGDTWNFTVSTSILPSDTCPGCFSYLINQKGRP